MTEVPTKIDYWGLQVPTYESNFSINPRWRNNENDPFICTAVFKKSYVERINAEGGTLSRSADNMLPAFFVYESDTLPIPEQLKICKNILNDALVASWIFSQTYSGSKSIHTLVYIAPEFPESITKVLKYIKSLRDSIYQTKLIRLMKIIHFNIKCTISVKKNCLIHNLPHHKFIAWQPAQNKLFSFHCANRSDEPLRSKIVFSKGFHDF